MTDQQAQRTREAICKTLLTTHQGTPGGVLGWAHDHCAGFDRNVALEFWWDLARVGAVALLGEGSGPYSLGEPRFILTERGRALLTRGESSPHDATRYLTSLRQRVKSPDPTALAYVEEAIGAWQAGLHRATAAMTGCACERLIIMLAEAVSRTALEPFASELRRHLAADSPQGISPMLEQVRGAMHASVQQKLVAGELADAIDRKLTPVFEQACVLRNDAGRPTGETVTAEEAEAGLLLFPGFHELVARWIAKLDELGGARTGNEANPAGGD